jgi:hypothetical protein
MITRMVGLALLLCSVMPALAAKIIVGVNTVDVQNMNQQQHDALLDQLQKSGVKIIRLGLDPRLTAFLIRAHRRGISADVIVPFQGTGEHIRPADPALGLNWKVDALSDADPVKFRAYLTAQLAPLEVAGVQLAALELDNEINSTGFNGDFPDSGSGRVFSMSDLNLAADEEIRTIAAGYRAYLKLLAVLKDVRDKTTVNRTTPILSAGLADPGLPGKYPGRKQDSVSVAGTIWYMRQYGLDQLVDGYGVHVYPSGDPSIPLAMRVSTLEHDTFSACTVGFKPCWLTEWGFTNTNESCPIDDHVRVQLIETMLNVYRKFADEGRLRAILYYSWSGHLNVKESHEALIRCGALTDAGKQVLLPMSTDQP